MLTVSLITLGSPDQLTGGYLYHQRMAEAAPEHDARLRFVSIPEAPFPLPARAGGTALRTGREDDVVVVDSIAAAYVGPALWGRAGGHHAPRHAIAASLHQPPGGVGHGPVRARLQAALDRSLYQRAGQLLVASQALADELATHGLSAAAMRVVPPGRDLPPPPDEPDPDLRQGRRAAFVSTGNWAPHKGTLELLDALSRLPPDAATLHLVGRDDLDPAYAGQVRRRLAEPDVASRVVVHGPLPRTQLALLYRAADAFVLASRQDAYGTVFGEAMAAGLPVAGWRAGNLPNLAADGLEGVIVAVGDTGALAAGLLRLADDAEWRARLGRSAAVRAESFPTWDESAADFFSALRELADTPR